MPNVRLGGGGSASLSDAKMNDSDDNDFTFDFTDDSRTTHSSSESSPTSRLSSRLDPPVLARPPQSVSYRMFRTTSGSSSQKKLPPVVGGKKKTAKKSEGAKRAPAVSAPFRPAVLLSQSTQASSSSSAALSSAPAPRTPSLARSSQPPPELFAICVDTRKDVYRDFEADAILSSFQSGMMSLLENGIRRGLFGKGSLAITGFCASSELDLTLSSPSSSSEDSAIESLSTLSYIEVPRSSFEPASNCSYLTSLLTKVSKLQIDCDLKADAAARKDATAAATAAAAAAAPSSTSSRSTSSSKQRSVVRFFGTQGSSPPRTIAATAASPAKSILGIGSSRLLAASASSSSIEVEGTLPNVHIRVYCPSINLIGGGGMRPPKSAHDENGDEENVEAAFYDSALKKFISTCVRTLSSPRIKSLTLVVIRSQETGVSSSSSSGFFRALKDSIFSASLDNFSLEIHNDKPHEFDLSLRAMIRATLPVLTTTFTLPHVDGDVEVHLDICPSLIPVERRGLDIVGAGRSARETCASHLEKSSLQSMEIVQLVDSRKIDASLLWGVPLLATPSKTMAGSSLEFRTSCVILGELCGVLVQDHLCLLLRTEARNALTGLHDYYLFVPQSHCKSAILTKVATAEQYLVDEDLHRDEGISDIEKEAYRAFVESSLDAFPTADFNPLLAVSSWKGIKTEGTGDVGVLNHNQKTDDDMYEEDDALLSRLVLAQEARSPAKNDDDMMSTDSDPEFEY